MKKLQMMCLTTVKNKYFWAALPVVAFIGFLVSLSLNEKIAAPGVLAYLKQSTIEAPSDAVVDKLYVDEQYHVYKNQILVELSSPSLAYQIERLQKDINFYTAYPSRLHQKKLSDAMEKQAVLITQLQALKIYAPTKGYVVKVDTPLHKGMSLKKGTPLFTFAEDNETYITAYVSESTIDKIKVKAPAMFYPEGSPYHKIPAVVLHKSDQKVEHLSWPYLASTYNGAIAVQAMQNNELRPTQNLYSVLLEVSDPRYTAEMIQRGVVVFNEKPKHSSFKMRNE